MRVGVFLLVTFGVSWTFGALALLFHGDVSVSAQVSRTLLSVAFMFGPLVGACVAQRAAGEKVLKPLGVAVRVNGWWLAAWLGPFVYAWLALLCSLPLPGVSWSSDFSGFWERMSSLLPPEQLETSRQELESLSPWVVWMMLISQPLLLGPLVNSVPAFGEELGWRGFLYRAWAPHGFWTSSVMIGVVWGAWHAPLIAQGHNYPQYPWLGIGLMILWCMLLSPPFTWLRLRTGSVIAVSITHGTLNASAGIALMFIKGGDELLVGMTGLAGLLALVLINGGLFVCTRHLPLEPCSRE